MFDETRVSNNIEIIRKIKNNEVLTALDAKTYSGWGGMRDAIFTPSIYKQLKELLSDEEIGSIKATTSNAYYTPKYIAQFVWKILTQKLGFYGGDILEPAAGIGVFLDTIPSSLNRCNIDSIEIDMLIATILRHKHHNINIVCAGFEKIYFGNKKYDLIISNPPYGKAKLFDESQKDLKHLYIHHYFLAKSARLLKDNGIIAMVLPSFVLDNNTQHARDIIAESGVNLILAYRLPDDLFNGATVTVDSPSCRLICRY